MKKVLFFIPTLGGGGAEKSLVNLVNSLDKSKYEITVMTLFNTGIYREKLADWIEYKWVFKRMFRANSYIFKMFSPKFLFKSFIKEQYDVLVSYLEGNTTRIISGCSDIGVKKIAWQHCTVKSKSDLFHPVYRNFEEAKKAYGTFNNIIAVSHEVKQHLAELLDREEQYRVIYNMIDVEDIQIKCIEEPEINFNKNVVNLISLGRLNKVKGYERLINVIHKLKNDTSLDIDINLYILGRGGLRTKLESLINKKGLKDSVYLLGFKENPYKYLNMADLYVSSSISEGFGTAVSEALVMGIPVVATDCSGMREMLGDNNEYGIVTENSEASLYDGIKLMIENQENLSNYKKQAQVRRVIFNPDNTIFEVQELLDDK
jgi:glycosyltransferase involved in cell wall biosynthesis